MTRRIIIEMGMGNDLHGQDYTKAASRAIDDAMRHSSLPILPALGMGHTQMQVRVTVGVAQSGTVDCDALAAAMPRGTVTVRAVQGGMDVINPDTGEVTVMASAAVEVFLPEQSGWVLRG